MQQRLRALQGSLYPSVALAKAGGKVRALRGPGLVQQWLYEITVVAAPRWRRP